MEELITTKEAAEMLGIKPQSLRKRVMKGLEPIPVRQHMGYPNLFRIADVNKMLTSKKHAS